MKLALGTVQFGLDYGLTNSEGQTPQSEVNAMLTLARNCGISLLDTASSYGESEAVLGICGLERQEFSVVTKTPAFKEEALGASDARTLRSSFEASLEKLKLASVYGLLIHNADDLAKDGAEALVDELKELKQAGLVKKIGVSVYNESQINSAAAFGLTDIVQAPLNLFDQRLRTALQTLKLSGTEVHARSLFLQGLLLTPAGELGEYFDELKPTLLAYHEAITKAGLSPLQAALDFAKQAQEIDYAILGACTAEQLQEIVDAYQAPRTEFDFSGYSLTEERFIVPSRWPNA